MFQWILLTQFIPGVAIILPYYLMFRWLGLLDSYLALVVVDLSIVLPYAIWTIKGFIDAIPEETGGPYPGDGSNGVDGDPRRSTAAMGGIFVGFKIDNAVRQIRGLMSTTR